MAPRDKMVFRSEREAWEHVLKLGVRIQDKDGTVHQAREVGVTLEAIARAALRQLHEGVHVNPSLDYARALGGRIRKRLAGTTHAGLGDRVTHDLMTGRLDKVRTADAETVAMALEKAGHTRTAKEFGTYWNQYQSGKR